MNSLRFRTWIDISTSAIRHNYKVFRKLIGKKVKLLGVVKSNAYGHELQGFGKTLAFLGVDWLGVDSITEALTLRKAGIQKPILVLGYTIPENLFLAAKNNISVSISGFESLVFISKMNKPPKIHIKIDSGMHRQGFQVDDIEKIISLLKKSNKIFIEGLFTHFAAAKDPVDTKDTYKQLEIFKKVVTQFKTAGFAPIIHAAATGGTINFPESHFDMVRIGIGLYGYWPAPETRAAFDDEFKKPPSGRFTLKPALTWKSIVSELKWVEKNEKIGYDLTETLQKRSRLAVVPIGYWHGYSRALSSKAHVLVKGQRAKVLGRVSMDMIVVDVTDVKNIKVSDEVVLIGKQGKEFVSADELATISNTSCYEIITRINPLIKKYYK